MPKWHIWGHLILYLFIIAWQLSEFTTLNTFPKPDFELSQNRNQQFSDENIGLNATYFTSNLQQRFQHS